MPGPLRARVVSVAALVSTISGCSVSTHSAISPLRTEPASAPALEATSPVGYLNEQTLPWPGSTTTIFRPLTVPALTSLPPTVGSPTHNPSQPPVIKTSFYAADPAAVAAAWVARAGNFDVTAPPAAERVAEISTDALIAELAADTSLPPPTDTIWFAHVVDATVTARLAGRADVRIVVDRGSITDGSESPIEIVTYTVTLVAVRSPTGQPDRWLVADARLP